MQQQVTATVKMVFDCSAAESPNERRDRIAEDIGRLYDADSTTGVACTGFEIEAIKPPATSRIHFLCAGCGSPDVRADAYTEWDVEAGAWVLHSVYDDKTCETCGSSCNLVEVDEATGIEIEAFGMISEGEDSRLVKDDETPEYYDLIVKTVPKEGGGTTDETFILHEFDDMDRAEVEIRLAAMEQLFPLSGVACHFGRADQ